MPEYDNQNDQLAFRNFRNESDYPLLLELNHISREADHDHETITFEVIAKVLSNMDGITPQQGVIIASLGEKPVGYSRLGWYSSHPDTRLYYQVSFLLPEYRTGMVLTHFDEQENQKHNRKRGYTEHIYVRPPWRGRGLASTLIASSLHVYCNMA